MPRVVGSAGVSLFMCGASGAVGGPGPYDDEVGEIPPRSCLVSCEPCLGCWVGAGAGTFTGLKFPYADGDGATGVEKGNQLV